MAPRDAAAAGRDWVAVILAIGIATAVNAITLAVFYDAIFGKDPGLSENATQILTTAFGGIVGVLGGYLGGRAVERAAQRDAPARPELVDERPVDDK